MSDNKKINWEIKLTANSEEEATALLKKISEIFNKVTEEISYTDELGNSFISQRVK